MNKTQLHKDTTFHQMITNSKFSKNARPILVDGVRYPSAVAAGRKIGCYGAYIRTCILNKKLCKGHKVEYASDEN
jgi:hypothetical protein